MFSRDTQCRLGVKELSLRDAVTIVVVSVLRRGGGDVFLNHYEDDHCGEVT